METEGEGPIPLVFLHGYSLSMEVWTRVMLRFAGGRYTCIRYDLRGFGGSSKPKTGYTMQQHAIDLGHLLEHLRLPRTVLIGHSLGGAIAQEFAVRHPGSLLALVSSNAFARHNSLPGIDAALQERADGFNDPEQARQMLTAAVRRYIAPRNLTPDDVDTFLRIALGSSTQALREQLLDAYSAPALDPKVMAALSMPVLSLTGANDTVVPIAQAIALSDVVPDSELVLIARAGHTPMWERPDAWAAAVLDFLDRRILAPDGAGQGPAVRAIQ